MRTCTDPDPVHSMASDKPHPSGLPGLPLDGSGCTWHNLWAALDPAGHSANVAWSKGLRITLLACMGSVARDGWGWPALYLVESCQRALGTGPRR
jgi:hypothetical protein